MQEVYTYHTDPGHGWLEVPVGDVLALDLTPGMFSPYSYRKGSFLFLEEDCDAELFMVAYAAKHGAYPRYVKRDTNNSAIRTYTHLAGEDYSWEKMIERCKALREKVAA